MLLKACGLHVCSIEHIRTGIRHIYMPQVVRIADCDMMFKLKYVLRSEERTKHDWRRFILDMRESRVFGEHFDISHEKRR